MRAFVTGATGFVGTNLIQELDKAGWEIIALCRPSSELRERKKCKKIIYAPGDIMDIESLRRGMPPAVDAVFHVAGSVGPVAHGKEDSRYGINQIGTRNVVTVALEKKVGRFLHTSTVLTLVVVPAAYTIIDDFRLFMGRLFFGKKKVKKEAVKIDTEKKVKVG